MDDLRRRLAAAETALREREAQDVRSRENEERYRSLFQNMGQGYCDLGLIRDAHGRAFNQIYLELNPAFERLFGVAVRDARGRTGHELFPELGPDWYEAIDRVVRLGRPERIEYEFAALGRWFEIFAHPRGGDRITALYEDITARKEAEFTLRASLERQQILVHELQHRTRNLIAVVDGIARQTLEHTGPNRRFIDQFNDRLIALARVQDLLARTDTRSVSIGDVVRLELDALGARLDGVRVQVSGPRIRLRSSVVQTIALAMHELATNARKYGALASDRGSLKVTWGTTEADGRSWLSLDWIEEGLDSAREAASLVTSAGYGRELIEEALPFALGARTTYSVEGAGVRCRIALPLDQVGKEEDDGEAA